VRGAQLATVGWVLSQAVKFVAYLVLARLVSPSDFGRFAAGSTIIGVGGLFAESGMMGALINRKDRFDEAASTAFFSLLISGTLLALLSLAASPIVSVVFRSPEIGTIAAVLSGWLFLRSVTVVPDAILQRQFSFARRVAVDPLGVLTFAVVALVLCAHGAGVWGLVAGTYASMLVQVLLAWGFARFRPRWVLASRQMWRQLASYSRHLVVAETIRRGIGQLDTVLLGRFSGSFALGQYANGVRLADQPAGVFVSVVAYVLLPALSSISDSPERIRAATRRIIGVVSAVAVPVSFAAVPLGESGAVLLLGSRWRLAGHVIEALCGLVAGTIIISVASEIFKAINKPKVLVRVQLFFACTTAVAVGSMAAFGPVAVGAAISLSFLVSAVFALTRVSPLIGLPMRIMARDFATPIIATAVMVAAMSAAGRTLDPLSHPRLVAFLFVGVQIVLGVAVYVAVLVSIDGGRRRDAGSFIGRLQARWRRPRVTPLPVPREPGTQ